MRRISIFITSILAFIVLSPCPQVEAIVIDAFEQGTYNSGYGYARSLQRWFDKDKRIEDFGC